MYQGEIQTNGKDAPLVQRSERTAYKRLISVQVTYGVPRGCSQVVRQQILAL